MIEQKRDPIFTETLPKYQAQFYIPPAYPDVSVDKNDLTVPDYENLERLYLNQQEEYGRLHKELFEFKQKHEILEATFSSLRHAYKEITVKSVKRFFKSKGVMSAAGAIVSFILIAAGNIMNWPPEVMTGINAAGGIFGGGALWGRISANSKVTL